MTSIGFTIRYSLAAFTTAMTSPSQPLRSLLRHTSHSSSRRTSSISRPNHRTFSHTTPRPLPRRRPGQLCEASAQKVVDEAEATIDHDDRFSIRRTNAELMSNRTIRDSTPKEYNQIDGPHWVGPPELGFFADGERGIDDDPDPEIDDDDISSLAHGELEQVREVRELMRVSAWDGPMLYQYRKEFQKPTEKTPLRFRYTTYLGETHPAAKKVVMDFSPQKLPGLSQVQCDKLIKLLGTRYDPHTRLAKMSSEKYPTTVQNKKHLVTLLERLLKETREGKDTFDDVPFDFRHAVRKPKVSFPPEWRLTPERRRFLEEQWAKNRRSEEQRKVNGKVADGKLLLGLSAEAFSEEPEMVVTQRRRHK